MLLTGLLNPRTPRTVIIIMAVFVFCYSVTSFKLSMSKQIKQIDTSWLCDIILYIAYIQECTDGNGR